MKKIALHVLIFLMTYGLYVGTTCSQDKERVECLTPERYDRALIFLHNENLLDSLQKKGGIEQGLTLGECALLMERYGFKDPWYRDAGWKETLLRHVIMPDNLHKHIVPQVLYYLKNSSANNNLVALTEYEFFLWRDGKKALRILLEKGVNINVVNPKNGRTPLMALTLLYSYYFHEGQKKYYDLLVQNGANINLITKIKSCIPFKFVLQSALQVAISTLNVEMVQLLLDSGASIAVSKLLKKKLKKQAKILKKKVKFLAIAALRYYVARKVLIKTVLPSDVINEIMHRHIDLKDMYEELHLT